ncbi:hypothetical protein IHE44_0012077, partial [Lamprotornis superbus]
DGLSFKKSDRTSFHMSYVDVARAIELLEKLQESGEVPVHKLQSLKKVLQSEFCTAIREVYQYMHETITVNGCPEFRARATAKATVAAFAASEGHSHPRVVELPKTEEGLGFNVMGGKEQNSPIYISRIIPGGVAERHGGLKRGDQLLSVNGVSVEGEHHEKAVELLKAAKDSVKLVVRYTPKVLEEMEARFEKLRTARRRQQQQLLIQQQQQQQTTQQNHMSALPGTRAHASPRQEQGSPSLGTCLEIVTGWDMSPQWVQFRGPDGWAGQGYGELETGPAGALLGQEMMALGADRRSWAVDRMEGAPRGTVRALEVPLGPQPALTAVKMSGAHSLVHFHMVFPSKGAFGKQVILKKEEASIKSSVIKQAELYSSIPAKANNYRNMKHNSSGECIFIYDLNLFSPDSTRYFHMHTAELVSRRTDGNKLQPLNANSRSLYCHPRHWASENVEPAPGSILTLSQCLQPSSVKVYYKKTSRKQCFICFQILFRSKFPPVYSPESACVSPAPPDSVQWHGRWNYQLNKCAKGDA